MAASYGGTAGSPVPAPKTVGGNGGIGGTGNAVTVTSNGTVFTTGALSDGIFAQSVGGGGGNGGFSVGAGLSYKGDSDVDSVGGNGGSGNTAGQVSVTASATAGSSPAGYSVVTQGDNSVGILAQSIGGGGGEGGFSIAASLSAGGDANGSTIGGSGGSGGNSLNGCTAGTGCTSASAGYVPAVTVTDTGSISTAGRNSSAIEAQSVGGGGGDGGFSIGVAGTTKDDSTSNLQTVGGNGGAAGNGADVVVMANATANATATISTAGDLSYGILAQSVGGGGGNGGFAIAGSLSTSGGAAANATGGGGTGGGDGGNVAVTMGGSISTGTASFVGGVFQNSTSGEGSIGILAQSIGGGGGSGGFSGGLALGLSDDGTTNTTGGNGGPGGSGATVAVTTLAGASITTYGDNASGILAQSVGGGGGNGAFSIGAAFSDSNGKSATNTVGGEGGVGGTGGDVTVTNAAAITTYGLMSNGIVAQSIGGGGGSGGFAVSGSLSLGGDAASNTTGGNGGTGQDAGTVTVTNTGNIAGRPSGQHRHPGAVDRRRRRQWRICAAASISRPAGRRRTTRSAGRARAAATATRSASPTPRRSLRSATRSSGIVAQSIGGGGGNGGFSISRRRLDAGHVVDAVGRWRGRRGRCRRQRHRAVQRGGEFDCVDHDTRRSGLRHSRPVGRRRRRQWRLRHLRFAVDQLRSGSRCDRRQRRGRRQRGHGVGHGGRLDLDRYGDLRQRCFSELDQRRRVGRHSRAVDRRRRRQWRLFRRSRARAWRRYNNKHDGRHGRGRRQRLYVSVTTLAGASIVTYGDNASGILAQSVGGGGGNGAFSIGAAFAESNGKSATNTVGGDGGGGGTGGDVTVDNAAAITTYGLMSNGISRAVDRRRRRQWRLCRFGLAVARRRCGVEHDGRRWRHRSGRRHGDGHQHRQYSNRAGRKRRHFGAVDRRRRW